MIHSIRAWNARHNDGLKLEAMSDRLLADIGVERAEIDDWLGGRRPVATRTSRPWNHRLRAAVIAFMRELRVDGEPKLSHERQSG